jgi:hypothetical protein
MRAGWQGHREDTVWQVGRRAKSLATFFMTDRRDGGGPVVEASLVRGGEDVDGG